MEDPLVSKRRRRAQSTPWSRMQEQWPHLGLYLLGQYIKAYRPTAATSNWGLYRLQQYRESLRLLMTFLKTKRMIIDVICLIYIHLHMPYIHFVEIFIQTFYQKYFELYNDHFNTDSLFVFSLFRPTIVIKGSIMRFGASEKHNEGK